MVFRMEKMEVRERALKLYAFLDRHRSLFDAHSVDFFTADHWCTVVPAEWQGLATPPPDEVLLFPRNHSCCGEY